MPKRPGDPSGAPRWPAQLLSSRSGVTRCYYSTLRHLTECLERTLLVVTHGTFLCMLICGMMAGEEVSPQWFDRIHHFLVLKNTALSMCEYDQGKWQLVIWND